MDLFPGFSERRLGTAHADLFARIGGNGPPIVLLHGFPETHACWHRVAPRLAERWTVVTCDLPGYGSSAPVESMDGASKRAMARDVVLAMKELGFPRFSVVGHDRGARVAYRLALDFPDHVDKLVALDIMPTFAMWTRLGDLEHAMKTYHWFVLAQPPPIPELLLSGAGSAYLRAVLASWAGSRDVSVFEPRVLAAYEEAYARQSTIRAACEDYRAGWALDRLHDRDDLDAGRTIARPVLVAWGHREFPDGAEVMRAWQRIAPGATGRAFDAGHFLAEEVPEEVVAMLFDFL